MGYGSWTKLETLITKSYHSDIRVISVFNLPQSISSKTKKAVLTDYQRNKRKSFQRMEKEQLVIDKIIQTVAEVYRINPKVIMGKTQIRDVSEARQICAYILREQKYKRSDIAQQLNRKPKTIYYELQQARNLLSADKSVKKHYKSIKKELELWAQH